MVRFSTILKSNGNHDALGRFAQGEGEASHEWSHRSIHGELSKLGLEHTYDVDMWHKKMGGVGPQEFFDTFFGKATKENLRGLEGGYHRERHFLQGGGY